MGSTASRARVVFRFGAFELLERDGELRKNGVRIKLQEQPFRVLYSRAAGKCRHGSDAGGVAAEAVAG